MKIKFKPLLILLLITISCTEERIDYKSWSTENINFKSSNEQFEKRIKTSIKTTYNVKESFGYVLKDDSVEFRRMQYKYDNNGKIAQIDYLELDGIEIIGQRYYKYNDDGLRIKESFYDEKGNAMYKWNFKHFEYEDKIAELKFDSLGELLNKRLIKYNKEGLQIKKITKEPYLKVTTFKYDDNRNEIEEIQKGELITSTYKTYYRYNSKGDWIKKIWCVKDKPRVYIERELEYYQNVDESIINDDYILSFKEDVIDLGEIENNIYTNDYFKLKMNILDNYENEIENNKVFKDSAIKFLSDDDEAKKKELRRSDVGKANLLFLLKTNVDYADFRPSLKLDTKNLDFKPNINKPSDMLEETVDYLKQSKLDIVYINDDYSKVNINGHNFTTLKMKVKFDGIHITQEAYSKIINDFYVSFLIAYDNEKDKDELMKMINSIEINY